MIKTTDENEYDLRIAKIDTPFSLINTILQYTCHQ